MRIYPAGDPHAIDRALDVLQRGGLVAYPTDTVYGLAADPANDAAVEKLFEAKSRRSDQSMPLLLADAAQLAGFVDDVPAIAATLSDHFWPGALTIVLTKARSLHSRAIVGESVGLRVPDHPVPRELARRLGRPITGTSANLAGGQEPLTAQDVVDQLGDAVDLVIDSGPCTGGAPSTVVDCTTDPPRMVREGAIGRAELERVAGVRFA